MNDPILSTQVNFPGHPEANPEAVPIEGQPSNTLPSCPPGEDPIYYAKRIAQMAYAVNTNQANVEEYDVGKLVLQKHSSSNMMAAEVTCDQVPDIDGLMRFNSNSFYRTRPELSRGNSEQVKNEASVHENYAELMLGDADTLAAKLNHVAMLKQLSLAKKEGKFIEENSRTEEVIEEFKDTRHEEVPCYEVISPNTTKSLLQKDRSKMSFPPIDTDLEANKSHDDKSPYGAQEFDPIEEEVGQDIVLTTQNGMELTQNENANLVITRTSPHSPIPFNEIKLDFEQAYGPETKIYLTKVVGLFTALVLTSASILFTIDTSIAFEQIIMIAFGYLAYLLIIDVFWTLNVMGELVLASDSIFRIYDVLSGFISILIIYFKSSNIFSTSIPACLPLLLTTLVYVFQSTSSQKSSGALTRTFLTVQTLLITLKLDGILTNEWSSVLLISWVFLTASIYYLLRSLFFLSQKVVKTHISQDKGGETSDMDSNKRIGFAWYLAYYGLSLLAPIALLGLIKAYGPAGNVEVLRIAAYLTLAVGGIMLVATVLLKKSLITFIISFGLLNGEESEMPEDNNNQQVDSEQPVAN